jgi:hypothetical protein
MMTSLAPASATTIPAAARGIEPVDLAVDASPPPTWPEFVAARERFLAQLAALPRTIAPANRPPVEG